MFWMRVLHLCHQRSYSPSPVDTLARRVGNDACCFPRAEHVGVDHEVILRWNLIVDAVEALEVVGTGPVRGADVTLGFRLATPRS